MRGYYADLVCHHREAAIAIWSGGFTPAGPANSGQIAARSVEKAFAVPVVPFKLEAIASAHLALRGPAHLRQLAVGKERARRGMSRHSLAVTSAIQERRPKAIELDQSPPSYQDIKGLAAVLNIPEQDLLEVAGCIKRAEGA